MLELKKKTPRKLVLPLTDSGRKFCIVKITIGNRKNLHSTKRKKKLKFQSCMPGTYLDMHIFKGLCKLTKEEAKYFVKSQKLCKSQ